MKTFRVLVISPDVKVSEFLRKNLMPKRFDIQTIRPGAEAATLASQQALDVAVVDRIDQRPDAAQLEIALLKHTHPSLKIIAISQQSSSLDAPVIEQGLFYYWTGPILPAFASLIEGTCLQG